ncbi:unnamed protein product, partial [Polarella glacialis]
VCHGSSSPEYLASMSPDEARGREWTEAMQRLLIIPCGGSTVNSTGSVVQSGSAMSCRDAFCPEGASAEKKASCASDCEQHPFFCTATCADFGAASAACKSCRTECAAACECSLYCEPLIKDAANCVEQGGRWLPTLSQNFDNVWSAMLTLFEISSTEGWADVMHVACDGVEEYVEPIRDYNQWAFVPFFMVYMFFSAMFIINLSVGVIVDKFMDLKHAGAGDLMLTDAQRKWVASHRQLCNRNIFFDLTDLHKLPPLRRK